MLLSISDLQEANMADTAKVAVPYLPWKTFLSVMESLSKFLPEHVHPSIWPNYSGGVRSQVIATLRFLNLVEASGAPTDLLHRITQAQPSAWPPLMREALKQSYTSLMECDLTRATPGSFDAEMRKFGQDGDTHRKAASFFLQAAKFAGVPLSPLLLKKGGLSATRKKTSAAKRSNGNTPSSGPKESTETEERRTTDPTGVNKTIHLDNESVLTLVLNRNFGELPSTQRRFVNKLFDLMEDFAESGLTDLPEDTK